MADMTAAAGVNALRQNAQQAGAQAAAGAGNQMINTAAAAQPAADIPTRQQAFQQQFTQPLIDQNVRAMRPDYGDPNEWSYASDAISLAYKDAQPGQNAVDMLLNNFGTYGSQAAAQRNAIAAGDVAAIRDYQAGTDPLLDIMINWEMPQGYNWAAGSGGASGVGVSGPGDGGASGGSGVGGDY
jgi:hypothetical protein